MADVKVSLPTIDALIKLMTESGALSTLLVGTASAVQTRVKKQWLAGSGADTTVFSPGDSEYLTKKGLAGRQPVINMSLTGQMMKSFKVQRANDKEAALGFSGNRSSTVLGKKIKNPPSNLEVARGNYARRPNMLSTDSKDLQDFATNVFNKLFKKAGKL